MGDFVVTGDDVNIELSVGSNGRADEVGGERDTKIRIEMKSN